MDTSLSTQKPRMKRNTGIIAAVIVVLVPLAVYIGWRATQRPVARVTAATTPAALTVPEGEAGKVGDLSITEEALQLAEIKTAPVTRQIVTQRLDVSGSIETGGDRSARITARVAGKVLSLSAVPGDAVQAGQTLGTIESPELARAQAALQQASAKLSAAESNLKRQQQLAKLGTFGQPKVQEARTGSVTSHSAVLTAESEVTAAQAAREEAKSEVKALRASLSQAQTLAKVSEQRVQRAERLLKEELIARQEWEQVQAEYQNALANVDAARAKVAQGEARVETAGAQVSTAQSKLEAAKKQEQIASQALTREEAVYKGQFLTSKELVEAEASVRQAQLDRQAAEQSIRLLGGTPGGGSTVPLTSPISGRIQERAVTLGETVDTEHALFTVVNLDSVWAQLAVAPRDLPDVHVGQKVALTADSAPGRSFTGSVSAIGNAADETTRTIRIRVALSNPGAALKPGALVRGQVVTDVRREAIAVPNDALQEHTGRPTVYVTRDDKNTKYEVRHVTLGTRGNGWREVTNGIQPGERIAVHGTFYLKSEALKSALSDGCCAVPGGK